MHAELLAAQRYLRYMGVYQEACNCAKQPRPFLAQTTTESNASCLNPIDTSYTILQQLLNIHAMALAYGT